MFIHKSLKWSHCEESNKSLFKLETYPACTLNSQNNPKIIQKNPKSHINPNNSQVISTKKANCSSQVKHIFLLRLASGFWLGTTCTCQTSSWFRFWSSNQSNHLPTHSQWSEYHVFKTLYQLLNISFQEFKNWLFWNSRWKMGGHNRLLYKPCWHLRKGLIWSPEDLANLGHQRKKLN